MAPGAGPAALLAALEGLDEQVAELRLPLPVAGAVPARRLRREVADQLDDYVLPRLRRLDAPLLAVVGGSTGAGKSTLVNSLVGRRVSASGVLRPTTRSRCLAYHPGDDEWFEDQRILPGLTRTTDAARPTPTTLQLVPSEGIPAGLAVLDAPDIDSVVTRNRELATQLLAAADMWLFVTTAARYADAVPWEFLRTAATRGTAVAVVLDRVPPEAIDEVRAHLATMLTEQGLGDAPLFVVPETTAYDALLPPDVVDPIRTWLHGIADDAEVRAAVVRHTLAGAIRSMAARVFELAAAADAQAEAVLRLRRDVDDGLRRRAGAGRRGERRRLPAAGRGAGPLAGVRRHRGADAGARVEGVAAARPGRRPPYRGSRRPATTSRRRSSREWRRWSGGRRHRGGAGCHGLGGRPGRRRAARHRRRPAVQLTGAGRRDHPDGARVAGRRARAGAQPGPVPQVHRPLPRVRRERARADGDGRGVRSHGRVDRWRGRRRRRRRRC